MIPVTPMLLRIPQPFDHPDFIYEPKIDAMEAGVTSHVWSVEEIVALMP